MKLTIAEQKQIIAEREQRRFARRIEKLTKQLQEMEKSRDYFALHAADQTDKNRRLERELKAARGDVDICEAVVGPYAILAPEDFKRTVTQRANRLLGRSSVAPPAPMPPAKPRRRK